MFQLKKKNVPIWKNKLFQLLKGIAWEEQDDKDNCIRPRDLSKVVIKNRKANNIKPMLILGGTTWANIIQSVFYGWQQAW